MPEREQRVTPLELFFDLVFVFAITQVTGMMSEDPTWAGLGRGLLVLAALWWAWAAYAWLTNSLEPEEGGVRLAMFTAMAAMLVVALAVPNAFETDGVLFGFAYVAVRLLHLVLYAIAGRSDPDLFGAVLRMTPSSLLGPVLILTAGFVDGNTQVLIWIVALAVDYLGVLVGRGQGFRVSPAHFAERHQLIVIVALGESIVALGIGAAGLPLSLRVVAAAIAGFVVIAALWWAYFDVFTIFAQRRLAELSGAHRARLARDYYSYLHLPMVAGIVLFALGMKETLAHVTSPLDAVPAAALCGGLSLFFFTHVAFRVRLVWKSWRETRDGRGLFGRGRPITAFVLLAILPVAREVPALTALSLVATICCGVIVYDVIHYREERTQIRQLR